MNTAAEPVEGTIEPPAVENTPIEYGVTDAAIAEVGERLKGLQITNKDEYEAVKRGIAEVRTLRTSVEKKRKQLKAGALEWGKKVDGEAKRITESLLLIEGPLKAVKENEDDRLLAIKAEKEEAERERVSRHETRIHQIRNYPLQFVGKTVAEIEKGLEALIAWKIDHDYEEYEIEAVQVMKQTIAAMEDLIEKANAAQAEKEREEAARAEEEAQRAVEDARRAEEREALRVQEEALEAAREKLQQEREALDAEKAEKKALEDAEREKAEREAEEKAKVKRQMEEQAARIKQDELDAIEAERRAEELRPDKDKALAFALDIKNATLAAPKVESDLLFVMITELACAVVTAADTLAEKVDKL